MKKVLLILLAVALGATIFLLAQSEWEGTTAMARYGEFPSGGLYGASNSFPRNTLVEVENLENGSSVTVMIVNRLDDPGLFLLLSREAAEKIGIQDDKMVRTRIVLADNTSRLSVESADRPYSDDPDLNPGAAGELSFLDRYLSTEETPPETAAVIPPAPEQIIAGPETAEESAEPEAPVLLAQGTGGLAAARPEEEPELTDAPAAAPAVTAGIVVAPEAEPVPAPQPAAPVLKGPFSEDFARMVPGEEPLSLVPAAPVLHESGKESRVADNLYNPVQPENGEEYIVADLPAVPAARERDRVLAEQFPLPQPPYNGDEEVSFAAVPPGLIEDRRPAAVAAAVTPPPSAAAVPEGDVEIHLEPADDRPPEGSASVVAAAKTPETAVPAETVVPPQKHEPEFSILSGDLDPASDYLQLAVFSTPASARSTAARFSPIYPVLVLNQDNALYKVLVGPLSSDESGALLLNFKAQGFRDAFIRKGF